MYSIFTPQEVKYTTNSGKEYILNIRRQHTLIKRFDTVFDLVNDFLQKYNDLKEEYDYFIESAVNENDSGKIVECFSTCLPKIISLIDKYVLKENLVTYEYEESKKSKTLHINENDYKFLVNTCIRSKFLNVVAIYLRPTNMVPVRYIFNLMCKELNALGISNKLELVINGVIQGVTVYGNDGQSHLWQVLETAKGIDTNCVSSRELNNVYYKGFPTFQLGKDPIKYFVSMVRTSTMYQMKDKIDVLNIMSSLPIEEEIPSSTNILKSFVYEELTNNTQLANLLSDFSFASILVNKNLMVTTKYIAVPFLSRVFDSATLNINKIKNILLLNLLTYKFMKDDTNCSKLINLLICYPEYDGETISESPNIKDMADINIHLERKEFESNLKKISYKVKDCFSNMGRPKVKYNRNLILGIYSKSLKEIFKYRFYKCNGDEYVVSPSCIIQEYVYFINSISNEMLNDKINEAKHYLNYIISENRELFCGEEGHE